MKVHWQFDQADTERVQAFIKSAENDSSFQLLVAKNIATDKPPVSKEQFWRCLAECLLSTQQIRPGSTFHRFIDTEPFPLRLEVCLAEIASLSIFASQLLHEFGGLRRSIIIGSQLDANLQYLESGGWDGTMAVLDNARKSQTPEAEREAAVFINEKLKGCGPMQARNLLQCLGVARYEIPISKRLTKWLSRNGFPTLFREPQQDDYTLDWIRQLCGRAGLFPCMLRRGNSCDCQKIFNEI